MKTLSTLKSILVAFTILLTVNAVHAQAAPKKVRLTEIMLNSYMSGNSFGIQRNPSIGLTIGKRLGLSGGPTFNRGFQKYTGGIIAVRYNMVSDGDGDNRHFRLISILSVQKMHNQSLSKNAVAVEQKMAFNMNNDESADFCELRYKGWEMAAGIGFAYRCDFGLMIRTEAALCYHNVDRSSCQPINAFHEEKGTSLRLGFGIGWALTGKAIPRVSEGAAVLML